MSTLDKKPKRTEEPEVRRTQILRAALVCFQETGFHATKMSEIASRAGLSVGLIYQFFPSKEALVEGLVAAEIDRQIAWLERQPRDQPLDIYGYLQTLSLPQTGGIGIRMEIIAELSRNRRLQESISSKQRQASALLMERIRDFLPGGGGPDAEEKLLLIAALYLGAQVLRIEQGSQASSKFMTLVEAACREQSAQLLTPPVHNRESSSIGLPQTGAQTAISGDQVEAIVAPSRGSPR